MKKKEEIVKMLLNKNLDTKDEEELIELLVDNPIAVDIDKKDEENITYGEKMADRLSEIAGSWGFILGFVSFLVFWIILNVYILKDGKVDPYPFILLNLVLSCLSAIQAPIIMMSQNRSAKKDSLRNKNDYMTDLKSELILEDLHDKIELVLKNQNKIINLLKEMRNKNE